MAGVKGKSGGKRAGAGRKPAAKKTLPEVRTTDGEFKRDDQTPPADVTDEAILLPQDGGNVALAFMRQVVVHPGVDVKVRLEAAKALAPYEAVRKAEVGKKVTKQKEAENTAGGRFGLRSPKLATSNGREV